MRRIALLALIVGTSAQPQKVSAQQPAVVSSATPKTQLEQFQAKTGSVIVKGYTDVGTVPGKYGSVAVTSMEFTDAATGTKQFGVAIEVRASGLSEQKNTSYIDLDEIDSLLNGIDYIGGVEKSATRLGNYEATYRTKGDFAITIFTMAKTGRMVAVESGKFGPAKAFLDISELPKLRQLIQKAKAALEAAK